MRNGERRAFLSLSLVCRGFGMGHVSFCSSPTPPPGPRFQSGGTRPKLFRESPLCSPSHTHGTGNAVHTDRRKCGVIEKNAWQRSLWTTRRGLRKSRTYLEFFEFWAFRPHGKTLKLVPKIWAERTNKRLRADTVDWDLLRNIPHTN